MINIKLIRNNLDYVCEELYKKRNFLFDKNLFIKLETKRKKIQTSNELLKNEKNKKIKLFAKLKNTGESLNLLHDEMKTISIKIDKNNSSLNKINNDLKNLLIYVPNIPHKSVPKGVSSENNEILRYFGERNIKSNFNFLDHGKIGRNLDLLDLDAAAKISGSRFSLMKGDFAKLHRSLINFMLDVHVNNFKYKEVYVPYIVNEKSLFCTGQIPKFEDDLFQVINDSGNKFYLIPTSEVPLCNIFRDEIINEDELPIKLVSHTPCFRKEAGSYGRDIKGIIRQHQFEKVELVQITKPNDSYNSLEEILFHAESILKKLDIRYRISLLCGGDLGFSSAKTYDIEVWIPSEKRYLEISSCSNCESFQSNRLNARYKNSITKKMENVHTLNGSGLAIGRTMLAIIENYQCSDGSVIIPDVLVNYMGNKTSIFKNIN